MALEPIGDWDRRHGRVVVLVHPDSPWGRRREEAERNGWKLIGRTRLWLDDGVFGHLNKDHPGLDVYEDVSLLGRWRRFWGRGDDELRRRALNMHDRPINHRFKPTGELR